MRMLAAAPTGAKAPPIGTNTAMMRYTIAYAGWRLAFSPALQAAEQSALLADAEEQLGQAVKLDASFAEAYGLLSSVYGAQIAKNPDLGMTLGMAAGESLGRAMSLDANSPRLVMLQALNLLHTPAEYGGDPKQAEALFHRALQMFDKEPAGKSWPTWLLCGLIIVVATAGKFVGTFAAARLCGLRPRDSAILGTLMNTRGLMELIVLNIGLELRVISPVLFAMMVLMALATTMSTAPMLAWLMRDHALRIR